MVKAWKEKVVIPTYEVGKPEKNPIFLEKRVYQGSSGVVYPYPVIESMSDEKVDTRQLLVAKGKSRIAGGDFWQRIWRQHGCHWDGRLCC